MATTTTSAAQVFAITELLESILLHVPPVKLYTLQRVNQTFCATIAGSTQLLQKMGLSTTDLDDPDSILVEPRVREALYPFGLISIVRPSLPTLEAEKRIIVAVANHYVYTSSFREVRRERIEVQEHTRQVASWRDIKLGWSGQKVELELLLGEHTRFVLLHDQSTLGELVGVCIEELRKYWTEEKEAVAALGIDDDF